PRMGVTSLLRTAIGWALYEKASSGAGDEKELLKRPGGIKAPSSWSRDGRFLLYDTFNVPKTVQDLWVLPLEGIVSQLSCWEWSSTNARAASPPICAGSLTSRISPAGLKCTSARFWPRDLPERLRSGRESGRFQKMVEDWRSGARTARS